MSGPLATSCYCGSCPTCAGTGPRPPVADPLQFAHGAIKRRLLGRIASVAIGDLRPLERLGVRDDGDPAIALVDAVAGSLHVLAWNAARLSDDGSIRRTEDREALVDLTRLLGYEPRPALAATTTLAFTLDVHEGAPKQASVPQGSKFASVPGQDEKPQVFETDAPLEARVAWNALKPVLAKAPPRIDVSTKEIVLAGASTSAKTGDLVLVYLQPQEAPAKWLCARIVMIHREPNPDRRPPQARLELSSPVLLDAPVGLSGSAFADRVIVLGQRAAAFGATAPDLKLMSDKVQDSQKEDITPIAALVPNGPQVRLQPADPEWKTLVMDPAPTAVGGALDLDAVYADAAAGRVALFSTRTGSPEPRIGLITEVAEGSRKDFGLAAKVTHIAVQGIDLSGFNNRVRDTTITLETSQEMLLVPDADVELPDQATDHVLVQGIVEPPVGRRIVLTGEAWTDGPAGRGAQISEVAILRAANPGIENTELVFERQIAGRFRSTTLRLLANAVAASHGETPSSGAEIIGSSDPAIPSPRFVLKGSPLAYVPAPNALGYAPALEVRAADRLYHEAPTLFGLASSDHAYTVRTGREGRSEIQFAQRLPSGAHNVSALYRIGGGRAGNLAAGRVTTALGPVLGVGSVVNPVASEGASDAETLEDMRTSAPQSIRTLDRVVSLADFEAFASRYRGIGKALATELRIGMRSIVCLTIATTDLTSPAPGSDIVEALTSALKRATPPGRIVRVAGFTDLTAHLKVALAIDPARRRSDVEGAVRAALGEAFSRAARRFGAALHRSQVLAIVQGVEGVLAATLPIFVLPGGPPESDGRLLAPAPAIVDGVFTPAGLLAVDPAAIEFGEMQP